MRNRFFTTSESEEEDHKLVTEALAGKRRALENLVKRHQGWIFNIAVRMTADFDKAEEITQEILIKIITRLDAYDSEKGAFRTWLYRIVANYVISLKRKEKRYVVAGGFKTFGEHIDSIPMEELPDEGSLSQESKLLVEESKNGCMTGMLLCFTPGGGWCISWEKYSMSAGGKALKSWGSAPRISEKFSPGRARICMSS